MWQYNTLIWAEYLNRDYKTPVDMFFFFQSIGAFFLKAEGAYTRSCQAGIN